MLNKHIMLDTESVKTGFAKLALLFEFLYSTLGLITGVIFLVAGVILLVHGVGGTTSWTATVLGLESELSDAAPGTIFAIAGLATIFVTRYRVKVRKGRTQKGSSPNAR